VSEASPVSACSTVYAFNDFTPESAINEESDGSSCLVAEDGVFVDSLTSVPMDLFDEFLAAGEEARMRGQHAIVRIAKSDRDVLMRLDLVTMPKRK